MTLVCFGSAKGAPGATLTSLVFASALSSVQPTLLLEADPAGGALAVRYRLARQPGLTSLVAASRHGLGRQELMSHAQELPGGLAAIVAPERGDRAASMLAAQGAELGRWLADLPDLTAVADCGRLTSTTLESGLAGRANQLFLVAQPRAEEIYPAAALGSTAMSLGMAVEWVLIGDSPYSVPEIEEATNIKVATVVPNDPRGAKAIEAGNQRRINRSRLTRAVSAFAAEWHAAVTTDVSAGNCDEGDDDGDAEGSEPTGIEGRDDSQRDMRTLGEMVRDHAASKEESGQVGVAR